MASSRGPADVGLELNSLMYGSRRTAEAPVTSTAWAMFEMACALVGLESSGYTTAHGITSSPADCAAGVMDSRLAIQLAGGVAVYEVDVPSEHLTKRPASFAASAMLTAAEAELKADG